jgi:hypothetical protein
MSNANSQPNYELNLDQCEICSELGGVERSFEKYGWPDDTQRLPSPASRLEPAENIEGYDKERHHVKQCPICGTFYKYDLTYEYLVNGSEDEETLKRLTPTESRRFLDDETYNALIQKMERNLTNPDVMARRHAGRSLISHYLELGDIAKMRTYLVAHTDSEVLRGGLAFLWNCEDDLYKLNEIAQLEDVLEKLRGHADENIAAISGYVLKGIK